MRDLTSLRACRPALALCGVLLLASALAHQVSGAGQASRAVRLFPAFSRYPVPVWPLREDLSVVLKRQKAGARLVDRTDEAEYVRAEAGDVALDGSLPLGGNVPDERNLVVVTSKAGAGKATRASGVRQQLDTITDTGAPYPDGALAAGRTHLVSAANRVLQFRTLSGTLVQTVDLAAFFPTEATHFITEPQLAYDAQSGRFILAAVGFNASTRASTCVVAVSATGDPTRAWSKYLFQAGRGGSPPTEYAEAPSLGYDAERITVALDMSSFATRAPTGNRLLIFRKAELVAGTMPSQPRIIENVAVPNSTSLARSLKPVESRGATGPLQLVARAGSAGIAHYRIATPFGTPVTTAILLPDGPFFPAGPAPQIGTSTPLQVGDMRLQKAYLNGDVIWTCGTVSSTEAAGGPGAVRVCAVDTRGGAGDPVFFYRILFLPPAGRHLFQPTLSWGDSTRLVVLYTQSGADIPATLRYDVFRQPNGWEGPLDLAAGAGPFVEPDAQGRTQWGRNAAACPDVASGGQNIWVQGPVAVTQGTWKLRAARMFAQLAPDIYEPDDAVQAFGAPDTIRPGAVQARTIHAAGNRDHAKFTLTQPSDVLMETAGTVGDTYMRLFRCNSGGGPTFLAEHNNIDDASNLFSRLSLRLPAGQYVIQVEDYANDGVIDNYTLRLEATPQGDVYEPDNTPFVFGQPDTIRPGETQTRSIELPSDLDHAKFTLTEPSDVTVETGPGRADAPPQWDTYLRLFRCNSGGGHTFLAEHNNINDATNLYSRITLRLPAGQYLIQVESYAHSMVIDAYTLSLRVTPRADRYEPDNTAYVLGQPDTIWAGQTQVRSIDLNDDLDHAKFTLREPADVTVETGPGTAPQPQWDTYLRLFRCNPGGGYTFLAEHNNINDATNLYSRITLRLPAGQYLIQVESYAHSMVIDSYTLRLTYTSRPDRYEPDDTPYVLGDPDTIHAGETQVRNINVNDDLDHAKFTLTQPSDVTVETGPPATGGNPAWDTYLRLYRCNEGGGHTLVGEHNNIDDASNLYSRITLRLPAGEYLAQVESYAHSMVIDAYTLSLRVTPRADRYEPDNTPFVSGNPDTIIPGQVQVRSIDLNDDLDHAKFTLREPADVTVETGPGTAAQPRWDTYMRLYRCNPGGGHTFLAEHNNIDDASNLYSRITLRLGPGEYLAQIESYAHSMVIDSYTLRLAVTPRPHDFYEPDDVLQPLGTADTISLNETQYRSIPLPGDRDHAKFTLTRETEVRIQTAAPVSGGNPAWDTFMRLYRCNEGGGHTFLAEHNNINDATNLYSRIEARLPAGQYVIEVEEYANDGTIDDYRLSLSLITYRIQGTARVNTLSGARLAGVTVTAGGKTAVTDSAGAYTLSGLRFGTYAVTATHPLYLVTPQEGTQPVTVGPDKAGVNFIARRAYSIRGKVTQGTATGTPLAGVVVAAGDRRGQTLADGTYVITYVLPGSYTLTATKAGYTFRPSGFTLPLQVSGDVTGKNWIGTPP